MGDVEYHACMVGSTRQKWQRLRGTVAKLKHLDQRWCDHSHPHDPWKEDGRFMTSYEAAYPAAFCHEVAKMWQPKNTNQIQNLATSVMELAITPAERRRSKLAALRSATNSQTKKHERLLQEYKWIYNDIKLPTYPKQLINNIIYNKSWVTSASATKDLPVETRMIRLRGPEGQHLNWQQVKEG